jgi:CubicO group peptidase (beta-lactamase class C family)
MPEKFPDIPEKRSITLRHLLTMKSGIDFDNDDFSIELYVDRPRDPVSYILHKPLYANPGEKFYYRDCDPHLLSSAVGQVTGKTLESWALERLFPQIGIVRYRWEKDPAGATMGAHGLYMMPRDLARFGQLILQRGRWNGTEVVSAEWIDRSTTGGTDSGLVEYDYGYYWWIVPELSAVTAWGHGGNFIFVAPDKDLVIVMVSMPDVDDDSVGTTLSEFMPLARVVYGACL